MMDDHADLSNTIQGTLEANTFKYLTFIDMILALYILVQNSVILYDYYPDRARISSLLFLLIAAADVITACFQLVRGTVAAICFNNETFTLQSWIFLLYIMPGLLSYITSMFFSVVLTIVRTLNIVCPFYRVSHNCLLSFLVLVPTFGLLISVLDMIFWHEHFQRDHDNGGEYRVCTVGQQRAYDNLIFIGGGVVIRIMDLSFVSSTRLYDILTLSLLTCQYIVPCGVVLCSMIVQMVHVSVLFGDGCTRKKSMAHHVNITVFLISTLFFLCNGSFALCFFVFYGYHVNADDPRYSVELVAKFTFPLLNAALFPTIIILRKPALRTRYMGYLVGAGSLLALLFRAGRRFSASDYVRI